MKNIAGLMKQASQMQKKMEDMQAALEASTVEGVAGAGMVHITMSGKGELKSLRIAPKLADARRKMEAAAAEEMQKVTGGLNLPAGMKLPF